MTNCDLKPLIHHFFEARLAGDTDKVLALIGPGMRMEMNGTVPNETIRCAVTPEEVRAYNDYLYRTWNWQSYEINRLAIDDNLVAVHYSLQAIYTPIDFLINAEFAEFITFRDGLMVDYLGFPDTQAISLLLNGTKPENAF